MHYSRGMFITPGAYRQGGAAAAGGRQCAGRDLPVQARRPERLRLPLDQPRQSRALAAAVEADRARGPDRRPALRHRRRPGAARGRGRRDRHRVDAPAHQAGGDGADQRRPASRPARCSIRGAGRTSRAFLSAASCRPWITASGRWRCRPGRCVSTACPQPKSNRRRCSASTPTEVLGDWLGLDAAAVAGLRQDGIV